MDAEGGQKFNFCSVCNKHFTGIEPYSQHIVSEKHKKKVKLLSDLGVITNDSLMVSSSQAAATPRVDMMVNNFHCKVCNKDILGKDQYQAHLKGQPHAKKLNTLEMLKEFSKQTNSGDSSATVLNIENPSANMFCKICNVPVCGASNYNQHIKGAAHKKREEAARLTSLLNEPPKSVEDEVIQQDSLSVHDSSVSDDVSDNEAKSIEQLREELSDVIFCPVDMNPMEVIKKLRFDQKSD